MGKNIYVHARLDTMMMKFVSTVLIILVLIVEEDATLIADGLCTREDGTNASSSLCVGHLSCKYYEDRLFISWDLPDDNLHTSDFLLSVSNISIIGIMKHLAVSRRSTSATLLTSQSSPRMMFSSNYNVTVKRRTSEIDANKGFHITAECVKPRMDVISTTVPHDEISPDHFSYERIINYHSPSLQAKTGQAKEESDVPSAGFNMLYMYGVVGGLCLITVCQTVVIVVMIRKIRQNAQMDRTSRSGNINHIEKGNNPHHGHPDCSEIEALGEDGLPRPGAMYTGLLQQGEDYDHTYTDLK